MAKSAGVITLRMRAGTAELFTDLDRTKAKVREFGRETVSQGRATDAALKMFEGGIKGNSRAVSAFVEQTLRLGGVLATAFPVVAGLAFAGFIGELGKKVYEFITSAEEAPEKIRDAFQALNEPLRTTNDELQVTNDRLAEDIAKLEGRRRNTLKTALDEARVAADKLAESLEKNLANLDKLLNEKGLSGFKAWLTNKQSTGPDADELKAFTEQIERVNSEGSLAVHRAKTREESQAAQDAWNQNLNRVFGEEIRKFEGKVSEAQMLQRIHSGKYTDQDRERFLRLHPEQARGRSGLYGEEYFAPLQAPDQSAVIRERQGVLSNLYQLRDSISLQASNTQLTAKKSELAAEVEVVKKAQEETKRLQEALRRAEVERFTGLEKISAEEQAEIARLREIGQYSKQNAALVSQIYNVKRITEYNQEMERSATTLKELADRWRQLELQSSKVLGSAFEADIEAGIKKLEDNAKAVTKVAEEYNRLGAAQGNEMLQHRISMAGIEGNPNDPLGTLKKQQDIERADIMARYEAAIKKANNALERGVAIRQRDLELARLDNEMEERTGELRQRGVRDFFIEMQGRAQSAGNILYEGLHSALDRASGELAKLVTGQKTNFGGMFKDLGEQMSRDAIRSGMQRGLGALGKMFGINIPGTEKADGTAASPFHVVIDDGGSAALAGGPFGSGDQGGGIFSLLSGGDEGESDNAGGGGGGGLLGALLGVLFGGGKPTEARAEGGPVSAGSAYLVGERGPELFFPGTSGSIMSNAAAQRSSGGGSSRHTYYIDARGAELGVENRVARSIEQAHASAVSTSVRANVERQKRTPERSKG